MLFPDGNIKDLEEIPAEVLKRVKMVPVKHFRDVAALALGPLPASAPEAKPSWLAPGAVVPKTNPSTQRPS